MAYVVGVGKTKFGRINKTLPELAYEAIREALVNAEVSINEIEAIFVGNYGCGVFNKQLHLGALIASLLPGIHIPVVRCENACASGGTALHQAIISLSRYSQVLVVGVEKMNQAPPISGSEYISIAGDYYLDYQEGLLFPTAYALMAQEHMKKYGTTLRDLSLVALKNHQNANLNPYAHFYGSEVTLEKIENSPVVASPLRLFDCSPVSDGAAAVVLSRNKKRRGDVKIVASVLISGYLSVSQTKDMTTIETTKIAAKLAYKQAKINPKQIKLAEVHDCFTIAEIIAIEDLGFCRPGEAKDLLREGKTGLGGDIVVNSDGGLKAGGHPLGATGISQVCEVVLQLKGLAGKRQVRNVELGLTHNIGGTGGTCTIHIFLRE